VIGTGIGNERLSTTSHFSPNQVLIVLSQDPPATLSGSDCGLGIRLPLCIKGSSPGYNSCLQTRLRVGWLKNG
jgi:hypothetical protein